MTAEYEADMLRGFAVDYRDLLDEKAEIQRQEKQLFRDMKKHGISQKAFKDAYSLIENQKKVEERKLAQLYYNRLKE
jgi:uncharacterized protein (UPF0335 family)